MNYNDLKFGDVFFIDGKPYQCYRKHERIAGALVLDENMQHIPDPTDTSGLGLRTTVYSDLRINTSNATPEECAAYLDQLRQRNAEL